MWKSGRPRPRKAWLAVATAAVVAAAGCGSGGGDNGGGGGNGKATITFANWADAEPNTKPGIEAMIKKFESLHPNITVQSKPISYTDIEHQLILQTQSGNPPDVAELQGNYTFSLQATGALEPLDDYVKGSYAQSVIPQELQLGKIGGKTVAVPWTVAPFALWYNKKVMKKAGLSGKPPATWDELLADVKAIHQKEPKVIAFGTDTTNRTYGLDQNWPIMQSFGAVPFRGSTATCDTAQMKAYLNFIRTLGQKGYTPANKKGGYYRQPAASDQVAFTVDGPYVKGVVQSTVKISDADFFAKWGIVPLPSGPAGPQHFSAPTDHQLAMFKDSKNKKAAWEFIKFLSTSDYAVQNYTLKYENSLPPLANPTGAIAKAMDNPISQEFQKNVIPTVGRPEWGAHYAGVYSDVMAGVQKAMTTSTPIDSVASSMQTAVKSDLNG